MNFILNLIGRDQELFVDDLIDNRNIINDLVCNSKFLVIGGAGSIGQAVVKEIFKRNPKVLHVIDISENNIAELVRDIRSSLGYINGDFQALPIDSDSIEFNAFANENGPYDYILNLSALKHVRSEKDPYTLMRLIKTNIFNANFLADLARKHGSKKYFCVSTDKAANPANMMGASKRIMEMYMMRCSMVQPLSMARFANVAFSDGSLLHGFNQRISKRQPFAAPSDVKRYFVTPEESGELCLLSCLLGENRDIFFPKLSEKLHLVTFSDIAVKYLNHLGYEPLLCESEEEARSKVEKAIPKKKWPCFFFKSDTTGEKDFEEFFTNSETLDMSRFDSIGIIKNTPEYNEELLELFTSSILKMKDRGSWSREELVELFHRMILDFGHKETGKFLDNRM